MADEKEFDRRAAGERLQRVARDAQNIRNRITSVINDYYERLPESEQEEASDRARMRARLIDEERALRELIDRYL